MSIHNNFELWYIRCYFCTVQSLVIVTRRLFETSLVCWEIVMIYNLKVENFSCLKFLMMIFIWCIFQSSVFIVYNKIVHTCRKRKGLWFMVLRLYFSCLDFSVKYHPQLTRSFFIVFLYLNLLHVSKNSFRHCLIMWHEGLSCKCPKIDIFVVNAILIPC